MGVWVGLHCVCCECVWPRLTQGLLLGPQLSWTLTLRVGADGVSDSNAKLEPRERADILNCCPPEFGAIW